MVGNPFGGASENEFGAIGLGFSGFEVSLNFVTGVPDPNSFTNSSLKLMFKSLLKRDETTKEKALNELASFLIPENINEFQQDLVLITWIQLYPKLSISENKSVRSLAHQIQCTLISILQKSFAKYLKDSIPVLLSGIYDIDSSVSNSTLRNLGQVFNNDQTKINNLWIIFSNEILNFIDQVLNKETVDSLSDDRFVSRDESELKYLRLVNSTISMTSHLLQLSIKLNKFDAKLENSFQDILKYENLWHYLLVNSNNNSQRIFKTLLSLTNAILKLKPELFTDKSWKLVSKRFLKSLTFVKKIDSNNSSSYLVYSSVIIPILSTLINLDQSNPDFYNFDKSAKERIVEFLKVGSLNSDSSYYTKVSEYLKISHIIDASEDFNVIQPILLNDFKTEVTRNSKFREGANYIINSLSTYLEQSSSDEDSLKLIFDEVLLINAPVIAKLVDLIVKYIPVSIISSKLQEAGEADNGINLAILLKIALLKKVDLEPLLSKTLDSLRDKSEEDEEGKSFTNHPAFQIFKFVIVENQDQYGSIVSEFIDELPTFVTPLIIDGPVEILISYSKSTLYKKELFIETFDSFLVKLSMIDSKDRLLSKLDQFANKAELLSSSEELQTTINEASTSYDFENDELFKEHLITEESVLELYNLSVESEKFDKFLDYFFVHNSNNEELFYHLIEKTSLIEDQLWKDGELNQKLHSKLDSFFNKDEFKSRYVSSLDKFISASGPTPEIIEEINSKISKFPELTHLIFNYDRFIGLVVDNYGESIDSRLSMGNPLESNIYLLEVEENSFPAESLEPLLKYARFVNELNLGESQELLWFLGIMAEIGTDYAFLSTSDVDRQSVELLQFKESVSQKVLGSVPDLKFNEVFGKLISGEETGTLIDHLTQNNDNQVLDFYSSRILLFILNSLRSKQFDFKASSIDVLQFDKFVKTNIRAKDPIQLLKFNTIISSVSDLLSDSSFEKLRNLIASELIGLKTSEILSSGFRKLIVLNNFLVSGHDADVDESPLQPQRLNLIINEINKWLESDVSFEDGFNLLRIQVLRFLSLLFSYDSLKSQQNIVDLIVRNLQDSIGLISVGDGEYLNELKYFALKLFLSVKKDESFDVETISDLDNELLESYKEEKQADEVNQPVINIDELVNRFINTLSIKTLQSHTDVLIEKYFKTSRFENKRILLQKLESLILSRQQDLVIEYELNHKDGNSDEADEDFKIQKIFIENILNPPNLNDIELENEEDKYNELLISYLWNWRLILIQFQDITLNLRNLYIKQLQNYQNNSELLSKFLTFLSNLIIVEINDDYLDGLKDHDIGSYTYSDINDLSLEVKNLGINLYYSILSHVGSLSFNWFNNLKDRGFKVKFENFTINYISPSLITDKLDNFSKKIDSFTSKDDNLTIKVNKLTNEIKVIYLIDEQNMEISFKIPNSYPLKNIEIIGISRIGVKEQVWKSWLLSSQRIIGITNGEIEESLNFFLKNVKFHFKGFEECAICYSILHSDNSLPSKKCTTCENKFHAGCLYKWFKSSGGNTCPLCRSTFNFR